MSTGTYVPYFGKVQTDNTGNTQKFALNPYFGVGTQYALSGPSYFSPEIGYVYMRENPKLSRTEVIMLQYNFSYILNPQWLFRYGLTNNWYRIVGKGGNQSLSNGTGTTSFPGPDKTITSYFTTLNLGSEFMFSNRKMSVRFDLNMMSFSKFEKRAYNYLLTLNFYR